MQLAVRSLPAAAGQPRATNSPMTMTDYDKLDAWIDAHFDEEVRFLQELVRVPTDTPPGNNAPHAERTAELLQGLRLRGREARRCRQPEVKDYGLRIDHQPDRAAPVRRTGRTIALNAHGDVVPPGEGWTHDPYGGEIEDGQHLRPRRRRQQERLRQLHLRACARSKPLGKPAQGRRRTALHLRRGVRRRAGPGLAAASNEPDASPT